MFHFLPEAGASEMFVFPNGIAFILNLISWWWGGGGVGLVEKKNSKKKKKKKRREFLSKNRREPTSPEEAPKNTKGSENVGNISLELCGFFFHPLTLAWNTHTHVPCLNRSNVPVVWFVVVVGVFFFAARSMAGRHAPVRRRRR